MCRQKKLGLHLHQYMSRWLIAGNGECYKGCFLKVYLFITYMCVCLLMVWWCFLPLPVIFTFKFSFVSNVHHSNSNSNQNKSACMPLWWKYLVICNDFATHICNINRHITLQFTEWETEREGGNERRMEAQTHTLHVICNILVKLNRLQQWRECENGWILKMSFPLYLSDDFRIRCM